MISVFGGNGYLLSEFCRKYRSSVFVQERDNYIPKTSTILYGISTVHNYNIYDDPFLDIDTNLNILVTVLENARAAHKDIEFNFISSWFVYGSTIDIPPKETTCCVPLGFYSVTKLAAEYLLTTYCQVYNIKYRILRMANVIGKKDPKASLKKNAFQFLITELAAGRDIEIYKMRAKRDYIDVRDAVQAIKLVIDKGVSDDIYNIGNGIPVAVQDEIKKAKEKFNLPGNIVEIPVPSFHSKVQVNALWLDTTRLRMLGYNQMYSLNDSISSMLE